jgi:hypothetical protein
MPGSSIQAVTVCESGSSQRSILKGWRGNVRTTEIGEKSTVSYGPGPEDLSWRLVWVMLGEILSCILLGEGSLETFERVGVEKVVWVVGFAWWVVWHWPVGGGGGRR